MVLRIVIDLVVQEKGKSDIMYFACVVLQGTRLIKRLANFARPRSTRRFCPSTTEIRPMRLRIRSQSSSECLTNNRQLGGMLADMPFQNVAQSPQAYDPNWFLSTTVQSTAALVAITSGFLISRLISTLSEKSGHIHRLAELEKRKQITLNEIEHQKRKIQFQVNAWFFDQNVDEIIESSGTIDVDHLVSNFYATGVDRISTKEYAELLLRIAKRAAEELSTVFDSRNPPPTSVHELKEVGFQINGFEEECIYEKMAEKMAERIDRISTAEKALRSLFVQAPTLELPYLIPIEDTRRQNEQIAKKSDLISSLAFIEAEIELINSRLPSLTDPKHFIWGFFVLAYFAGIGIFYPLFYMTKNPVLAPANIRFRVYAGFLSAFIVLFLYIANEVLKLRSNKFFVPFISNPFRRNSR